MSAERTGLAGLAVRNGSRVGLAALVAILLLGLALRLDYAWEGRAPVFDAAAYGRIAANLDRDRGFTLGEGATQPASNYSPGIPLLAAGLYKLSGGVHERFARLVLALIGALSVLFAYLIGRRLSGPAAGLVGATAVAVYPALLEYQGMLMGEPLAATLLSGAALAMLWANSPNGHGARVLSRVMGGLADSPVRTPPSPAPPARGWLVPGLLLGALALVRPEYLAVSLLIALVAIVSDRGDWRSGSARAGVFLLGVAVVVGPWTVRNAIALDRFVPISTGGGQVLFAGSYMPSGGDPERVGREVLARHPGLTRRLAAPAASSGHGGFLPHSDTNPPPVDAVLAQVRLEEILAALAAQRYPRLESDRALARMGRERLRSDVTEQPLAYAGFVAAKVSRIWSHGPRDVMREPLWEALHWVLVAFGLLGLVLLARRRRPEALVLATVLLSITAISAVLVASPRRVLVMMPLVAPLAGAGAVCAYRWLRTRRPERA